MAHPLELSYNWRTPAFFASVAAAICVGVLARGRVTGWVSALLVVVALWALIVGVIYLRTRAYLLIDGSRLTVRRFRTFHTIEAADLIAVAEFVTPNGPSYRLTVAYARRGNQPHRRPSRAAARRAFGPLHVDTGSSTSGNAGQGLPEDRGKAEDPRTDPMNGDGTPSAGPSAVLGR